MPKLYGRVESNNLISANASHLTWHDKELSGYLELLGIMVAPDLDPATRESHLDYMIIEVDDKQFLDRFKVNYYANMLPFAQVHPGRRPMNVFTPSVKINKGREFGLRFYADATGVDDVYYVRPVGLLYTEDEVKEIFGLDDPDKFETLEGGYGQTSPKVLPFNKYSTNDKATKAGEWYDLDDLSFIVRPHQELTIVAIGCVPHANQTKLQIAKGDKAIVNAVDPFTTTPDFNELPWGNAWQDAGPYVFPETVRPVFRDEYLRVQIMGPAVIPAGGALVWVKGTWKEGV